MRQERGTKGHGGGGVAGPGFFTATYPPHPTLEIGTKVLDHRR